MVVDWKRRLFTRYSPDKECSQPETEIASHILNSHLLSLCFFLVFVFVFLFVVIYFCLYLYLYLYLPDKESSQVQTEIAILKISIPFHNVSHKILMIDDNGDDDDDDDDNADDDDWWQCWWWWLMMEAIISKSPSDWRHIQS